MVVLFNKNTKRIHFEASKRGSFMESDNYRTKIKKGLSDGQSLKSKNQFKIKSK